MTESELIKALSEAATQEVGGDSAMTTLEVADALGVSTAVARRQLHKLMRDGRLDCVRVRRRDHLTPMVRIVTAYRLKESTDERRAESEPAA